MFFFTVEHDVNTKKYKKTSFVLVVIITIVVTICIFKLNRSKAASGLG